MGKYMGRRVSVNNSRGRLNSARGVKFLPAKMILDCMIMAGMFGMDK